MEVILPFGKSFIAATLFILIFVPGCSQVPISIDTSTYISFKKMADEQKRQDIHPLIGIYRAIFYSKSIIERPEEGIPVNGDWKFAVVKRGAAVDFISLSGYKGFGGLSDQGASFSVNLQGSSIWSLPYDKGDAGRREFIGAPSGVMDAQNKGKSVIRVMEGGWLIIQTNYDSSDSKKETFFLRKMEE